MSKLITRLSTVAFGLFVVFGLAFGASEAFGSSAPSVCNLSGQIGTCPGDYDDDLDCDDGCFEEGYPGGMCWSGCCECLY